MINHSAVFWEHCHVSLSFLSLVPIYARKPCTLSPMLQLTLSGKPCFIFRKVKASGEKLPRHPPTSANLLPTKANRPFIPRNTSLPSRGLTLLISSLTCSGPKAPWSLELKSNKFFLKGQEEGYNMRGQYLFCKCEYKNNLPICYYHVLDKKGIFNTKK